MQIDLTPFPKREGGTIQSLSPFRREVWREVKIVPHACQEPLYTQLYLNKTQSIFNWQILIIHRQTKILNLDNYSQHE
jgi:hypothetical protein